MKIQIQVHDSTVLLPIYLKACQNIVFDFSRKKGEKKLANVLEKPYSGSKYPTVPRTMLDTWETPSAASFDRPKSETFARMLLSRRILLVFKSRWIMHETQPVWRYSIPKTRAQESNYFLWSKSRFRFNLKSGETLWFQNLKWIV